MMIYYYMATELLCLISDPWKDRPLERYTKGTKESRSADYELKTQCGGQVYQNKYYIDKFLILASVGELLLIHKMMHLHWHLYLVSHHNGLGLGVWLSQLLLSQKILVELAPMSMLS